MLRASAVSRDTITSRNRAISATRSIVIFRRYSAPKCVGLSAASVVSGAAEVPSQRDPSAEREPTSPV